MSQIWQASYRSTFSGVDFVNTFHLWSDGPNDIDTYAGDIAATLNTSLTTLYKACLNSSYTLQELKVRSVQQTPPQAAVVSIGAVGTLASGGTQNISRELCLVATIWTGYSGRAYRGRMFFPSPLGASYAADTASWSTGTAYWSGIGSFLSAYIAGGSVTGISGETWHAGVYSKKLGQINDATSYTRRPEYHFLRSRRTAP